MNAATRSLLFFAVFKVAAVVLLTAGILKLASPSALAATDLTEPFLTAIAGLEILLGLWLLVGWHPRQTRWVALLAFSGLLGLALLKVFRGDQSCHCFGEFSVNPWWMVLFDGSVVAVLLAASLEATPNRCRWRPVTACMLALLGVAAGAYGGHDILAPPAATKGAVVLTASSWEQPAQRIFEDADIGEQMRQGEWVILLHRSGCQRCVETLPRYRQLASEMHLDGHTIRFAVVEIPTTDAGGSSDSAPEGPLTVGRLRGDRPWIAQTPFFLHALDGRVYRVDTGLARLEEKYRPGHRRDWLSAASRAPRPD